MEKQCPIRADFVEKAVRCRMNEGPHQAEGCRLPQRKMGTAAVLQARSQPIDTICNGYDLEYGALAFSIGIAAEPDHTESCFPQL